jgi:hypothetical protein
MDDIYDATPRKTDTPDQPQIAVEPKAKKGPQVDFSETASSIRRSSPYMTSDTRKDLWDFSVRLSAMGTIESYDWPKGP